MRSILAVVGWSLFWTFVILGVGAILLEWQALVHLTGL